MSGQPTRTDGAHATREAILAASEQLFAEKGVYTASHRQISEAAGQGNNAAVNYHFGTKQDLLRALLRQRHERIEQIRAPMVAEVTGSTDIRDWIACMVRPTTEHLAELGAPTWFGRLTAQLSTDPQLHEIMAEESRSAPSLMRAIDGMNRCLPNLPAEVRRERSDMARELTVHMIAQRERAIAQGLPTSRATWQDAATGLIDGLVGMWHAAFTQPRE